MNPSSRGWIKKFFSLLDNYEEKLKHYPEDLPTEELLYGYLQPTGMLYGFPVHFLLMEDEIAVHWSGEEKFKVLLLEGLMMVYHAHFGTLDTAHPEPFLNHCVRFYAAAETEKTKKGRAYATSVDDYEQLESIIARRVTIKMRLTHTWWTAYLPNSLTFQDVLFYNESIVRPDRPIAKKQNAVMMDTLKLITVAAHADGAISEQEEALFDVFVASARLTTTEREVMRSFWETPPALDAVELQGDLSWLLKRYLLEIVTLTVWSDKTVTPEETLFLTELQQKLNVEEEERDKAFLAIQSFILHNADAIPFLSGKKETEQWIGGAADRWRKILVRNKHKLIVELQESKELVVLIATSTSRELTSEEKRKVNRQLKDLGRTIPAFTLFLLPGGSLILPLVLKLIPGLIPSAFRSNEVDEKE